MTVLLGPGQVDPGLRSGRIRDVEGLEDLSGRGQSRRRPTGLPLILAPVMTGAVLGAGGGLEGRIRLRVG